MVFKKLSLALSLGLIMGCTQVAFNPIIGQVGQTIQGAIPPALQPAPIQMNQGVCNYSQSLTSCMSCPAAPVPPPPTKAQQLALIMGLSCPIRNSSDPQGYVSPTFNQINSRLDQCTEEIYQISGGQVGNPTPAQSSLISALLSSDNSTRQQMFGSRWYTPPYSDNFETYFGITVAEARYVFCYDSNNISGILATTPYVQASYDGQGPDAWYNSNPTGPDQTAFRVGNIFRNELKSCLDLPQKPMPTPTPAKTCSYKTFPSIDSKNALIEAAKMLSLGYVVSAEDNSSCQQVTAQTVFTGLASKMVLSGMLCK